MKQDIHDYFARHVTAAIAGMKQALQAQSFYRRLEVRLARGEDLSDEVASFASVGVEGALEVVREAIKENQHKVTSVWELPLGVQALGAQSIRLSMEHAELIPRCTLNFVYKGSAGDVLVTCTTANENFNIEITTKAKKMAQELALKEFFNELSYDLLRS